MLDIICLGRSSVDLYGQQVGGRLEDMASFAKYVGGCPTNISIGTARLGLRSGLITRVGDEHMGRFIREQLEREGVDTSGVITDPERLTALVILGIRNRQQFPLIFYRENCADMALSPDDLDPELIENAKAVLVTGTHFSTPSTDAACRHAASLAHKAGRLVVFDIDYRPNLWNLAGHGAGESRFVADEKTSRHLQTILPLCDLIVGTEEEFHIAGGTTDTLAAIRRAQDLAPVGAVLVCKRGAMGCTVFTERADSWEAGILGPGTEVEVYNVLGAGDGFMSGFLYGWLRDQPLLDCARYANACGALAVSRHGCAPAYPSEIELRWLVEHGSSEFALRKDQKLSRIHEATTRPRRWNRLVAFAFDHRVQFLKVAEAHGKGEAEIHRFKTLALEAVRHGGKGDPGQGLLVDDWLGREALHEAAALGPNGQSAWIGRPLEVSGVFPLELEEGPDIGSRLNEWPTTHCVKVLFPYRLDDDVEVRRKHEALLLRLADACRRTRHELLVEIITSRTVETADKPGGEAQHKGQDPKMTPVIMGIIYELGVYPDWWKLEAIEDRTFWQECSDLVAEHDPHAQGIIVLGKRAAPEVMQRIFTTAAGVEHVKGFAVGRTIYEETLAAWLASTLDDDEAIEHMAQAYRNLIHLWDQALQAAAQSPDGA